MFVVFVDISHTHTQKKNAEKKKNDNKHKQTHSLKTQRMDQVTFVGVTVPNEIKMLPKLLALVTDKAGVAVVKDLISGE